VYSGGRPLPERGGGLSVGAPYPGGGTGALAISSLMYSFHMYLLVKTYKISYSQRTVWSGSGHDHDHPPLVMLKAPWPDVEINKTIRKICSLPIPF